MIYQCWQYPFVQEKFVPVEQYGAPQIDLILRNSLLHYLTDPDMDRVLKESHNVLAEGSTIHILDLVMPEKKEIAKTLAKMDMGSFPRPISSAGDEGDDIYVKPGYFMPVGFSGKNMI